MMAAVERIAALAGSLLFGVLSGLIPVVNAEAYLAATAGVSALPLAIGVALAVSVGQTIGKLLVFLAARRGRTLRLPWRRRPAVTAASPVADPSAVPDAAADPLAVTGTDGGAAADRGAGVGVEPAPARPGRVRATLREWGRRGLELLDRPWLGGGVILASAAVGVPPLAVTTVAAGLSRMRTALFAVTVLVGRTGWFLLVTLASDRLAGTFLGR